VKIKAELTDQMLILSIIHPTGGKQMDYQKTEDSAEQSFNSSGPAFDIVAVAASAGGLNALSQVLAQLPANFPVPILIVQHLDPRHRSLMAEILSRKTPLQVKQAEEGDSLIQGMVYIAPPNRHLLVNPDRTLSLSQSELVHFLRPSADLMFDSVAASHKDRAIAVVLTGTGKDGAMGVQAIRKMGGTVIAQDEATSEFFSMPSAAIQMGADFVLPLSEMAVALVSLVMQPEDKA
jgi:two-component system, chemotaxis family, protein-glutamate methylesterase/glutaminase